jgi:hypothetical protein
LSIRLGLFALAACLVLTTSAQVSLAGAPPPVVPPPGIHMQKVGDPVAVPSFSAAAVFGSRVVVVYDGVPPWLVEATPDGAVVASAEIPEGYNAWGVALAPDGTVYTATTSNTSPHRGYLWAWKPGGRVVLAATLPGVVTVWSLAVDSTTGLVWIGAHGGLFAYDPASGRVTSYGMPQPGEVDVHAVFAAGGIVYAGLTPQAEVVRLDPSTQSWAVVASNPGTSGVRAITLAPDGSLLVTWGSETLLQYGAGLPAAYLSRALLAPVWLNGQPYTFQSDGTVAVGFYHTWRNPPVLLRVNPDDTPWSQHIRAAGLDGSRLLAVFGDGTLFDVDPTTGEASVRRIAFANPSPGIIHALGTTADGAIWASVYLGGEVTRVVGRRFQVLPFPFQVDAFASLGDTLYLGAYPGAYLYAYDIAQPWDLSSNPRLVGRVELPGGPEQDRVFALAAGPAGVFVGTIPAPGALAGALGDYNPTTGTFTVYRSPVPSQAITSLTFANNGLLIGTTTALGGGGTEPATASGEVFVWDPVHQSTVKTLVPLEGVPAWGGLVSTPDGVFGASPRAVFRLDPTTLAITARAFRSTAPSDPWASLTHLVWWRGRLFLLTMGQLYQVDPRTLQVTKLFFGAEQAAVDGDTLYLSYHDSVELVTVPLARLTPQNCVYPLHYIEWMDQHPDQIP